MKKLWVLLLVVGLISAIILSGCSQSTPTPAPSATSKAPTSAPTTQAPASSGSAIKLKAVTFQAANASSTAGFMIYANAVNAKGKGKVEITYLGGPEVVTRDNAPQAAKNGVVDMVYEPFTFYGGVVPIGNAMQFSEITAQQEIANGLWDYVRGLHSKAGLFWVGRGNSGLDGDTVWNSVKPVTKMADLAGQKAGSGSLTSKPLVQKLGATFVQVAVGDVFTGLQTGVIDSYITPPNGQVAASAQKAGKFIVNHPFYAANQSIFMGSDKYNSLPKDVQDILTSTLLEQQDALNKQYHDSNQSDLQKMVDAGEKLVTLPGDEPQKYLDLANSSAKEDVLKSYPDSGPYHPETRK